MADKTYTKSNDYVILKTIVDSFKDFPADEDSQRELAKLAYTRINVPGGSEDVDKAPSKNVYGAAKNLFDNAHKKIKELSPTEKCVLDLLLETAQTQRDEYSKCHLEERIAIMLENCMTVNPGVEAAIRKYGGYELQPIDIAFDPETFA